MWKSLKEKLVRFKKWVWGFLAITTSVAILTVPTFYQTTEVMLGAGETIKVLVVAGGGGGGKYGGGGGAGGLIYNATYTVTAGDYGITIGAGGASAANTSVKGANGSDSVFDTANRTAILTATGGGGGGSTGNINGANGGSGGGGANTTGAGGTGSQGNNGGANVSNGKGGGGGGFAAAGAAGTSGAGGAGGIGAADADVGNLLSMSSAPDTDHIAGGGGGSINAGGNGGDGGGGAGSTDGSASGDSGVPNTGGGAGGKGDGAATSGGSGIVIVAYTTAEFTHTGGDATGTSGSETWVKFTSSGTLALTEVPAGGGSTPRRQIIEEARNDFKFEEAVMVKLA